ncbi:MAG TPA: GIY-YIG nuclease family protein [Patescibacteria group bacterium]|nr:GIY-YIG nuclease family protein [Patescibacteria group bacterium]
MMDWFVYIVECADKSYYTGITTNINRRILQHNTNTFGSKYIRSRRPVHTVYIERKRSRSTALRRENEIKQWSREKKQHLILGQI